MTYSADGSLFLLSSRDNSSVFSSIFQAVAPALDEMASPLTIITELVCTAVTTTQHTVSELLGRNAEAINQMHQVLPSAMEAMLRMDLTVGLAAALGCCMVNSSNRALVLNWKCQFLTRFFFCVLDMFLRLLSRPLQSVLASAGGLPRAVLGKIVFGGYYLLTPLALQTVG